MDARQDEVIRALERETSLHPAGESLSRLALALTRAGRHEEAFAAAARALAADPTQPCRELVRPNACAYRSGSVAWEALPPGSPRLLATTAPWQLEPPVDLGGGVVLFGPEPHEGTGVELSAIDFLSDRTLWTARLPGVRHLIAAASPDRVLAVREPRPGEPEVVLLDSRTGTELAARALGLDPRALARLPVAAPRHENTLRYAFALAAVHDRPFAIAAGDTAPLALREPPFDLPCLLVPDAVSTDWVNPPWSGPAIAGDRVAISMPVAPFGVRCHDARLERSWHRERSWVQGTVDADFILWESDERKLQVVAGLTGEVLRERTPGFLPRSAFATRETLVVSPNGFAEAPLLGLDRKTLETRWRLPATLTVSGSASSVCLLGGRHPDPSVRVTVLDASTGEKTFETVLPGEPGLASALFLAGRLFVLTTKGTFRLDGA